MLVINKNVTVNGRSMIDGEQVAYMSATMSSDNGNNNTMTKTITNQELYAANKVSVRKDMQDFENAVYEIQDTLVVGGEIDETI